MTKMEKSIIENTAENIVAGNSMILKKSMVRRIEILTNDFNSWWDQKEYKYEKWCLEYLSPPPSSYFTNILYYNDEEKD